ncbi:TPR repeat [Geitlerinema sp. FC II]|nr:TPR repeat [Geitlerinema sp. FC II]
MTDDAQNLTARQHYHHGNDRFNANSLDEAIAAYQAAIELQPDVASYHYNLGNTYFAQQQFDRAIAAYQVSIQCDPEFFEAYFSLSHAYEHQGNFKAAIAGYRHATRLNPKALQAYDILAKLHLLQGNFHEAIDTYRQILRLFPEFFETYQRWLTHLDRSRILDETRHYRDRFLRGLQQTADSADVWYVLASLLARHGQVKLAILAYQHTLELDPDFIDAYHSLGSLYNQQGYFEAAIHTLEIARRRDGDRETLTLELAKSIALLRCHDAAIALLREFLERHPQSANCFYYLGKLLWIVRCPDEAFQAFRHAGTLQPYGGRDVYSLGIALAQAEKPNAAYDALLPRRRPSPPQGYYATTRDWAIATNCLSLYRRVRSPHSVTLSAPKALPNQYSPATDATFHFGEAFVATIPRGRAYWSGDARRDDYASAVIAPDDRLLADVSIDFTARLNSTGDRHPSQHRIFHEKHLSPIEDFDETIAILSPINCDNYYHWMVYLLPRLGLIIESKIDLETIDRFLIDSFYQPFQKETFQQLEIPKQKVLTVDRSPHIRAQKLIVPSIPSDLIAIDRASCQWIKSLFLPRSQELPTPDKRLYIRRKTGQNRRVIEEEQLIEFLEIYGFEAVELENKSIVEQAQLFAAAEAVIAPHGAGLTNVLFCQPGTKIIEILSPNYAHQFYAILSRQCQLDYAYCWSRSLSLDHFNDVFWMTIMREDLWVDRDRLLATMKLLEIV